MSWNSRRWKFRRKPSSAIWRFPSRLNSPNESNRRPAKSKIRASIAETLKSALEKDDFVARVEVAGAGYLNVFYNRAKFLAEAAIAEPLPKSNKTDETAPKRMVEHTSVNPNKAAHIGHVRNSVLGDTFVRILQANGKRVEVQNYIDNTGVQVADVVVGFVYLEKMNLEDIKQLDEDLKAEGKTFDYYCWDLYTKVGKDIRKRTKN